MPKTIQHHAHKNHPLVFRGFGRYICNGCGCCGAGPRFRCGACDFDLHELCASPPSAAHFFLHDEHRLAFEPVIGPILWRLCSICETPICGVHYRCSPVCSQLPATAVSPLHPEHVVTLTVGARATWCTRCGVSCASRYGCGRCNFNLHPKCLLGTEQTQLNIPKI